MTALTVAPYSSDLEAWRAEIEAKRQQAQRFRLLDRAAIEAENRPAPSPERAEPTPIDDLIRMYVDEGKTTAQIGAIIGRHPRSVQGRLSKAGVLRSKDEASARRKSPPKPRKSPPVKVPLETLVHLYVVEEMTAHQVAAKVGMSGAAVTLRLSRAGLMRTRAEARQLSMRKGRMAWMK